MLISWSSRIREYGLVETPLAKGPTAATPTGAKVTELRGGSVNSVSIGCIKRNPIAVGMG